MILYRRSRYKENLTIKEAQWSSGKNGSVIVQKVAVKHKFEAGLRHATTGKFSTSVQQRNVLFSQFREG